MKLLATVQDLSDWIGEPIPEQEEEREHKRATLCLRIASALVRSEADTTWEEVDVPEEIFMVTLYCASRVFENREAETQSGIDDWQAARRVLEAGAYLTATEKQMVRRHKRASFGGLGVIATTRDERPSVSGLVPTGTPGVEFPWY